ncbi:AAA family ATPase [Methylobacter sp. YRD-M1]|uniref:AAA family ATPase n=1 Tax=Methylobacter sp. YRD-M1 TaxID=2911520 RepID=UPI00227D3D9B|nr:AAA family ATPase [Methylobacter sp. YRD-M1]WAK02662.1 AAA family ATPase [Methylobacter sp. YRD-M1]
MKTLLNFKILDKLGESMHADVFKAYALNDQDKLLAVKKIRPQFCSEDAVSYIRQQINQLSELELPRSIIPELYHPAIDTLCLIQPYIEAQPLSRWLESHTAPDLITTLNIIIAIAEQLEDIHKAGHIHKSLKPTNILIEPETLAVQIIDDIRVLDINQLSHFIYEDHFRVQTLPYLSPEQTGRIKHSVNYTTDLYSLGMLFFECLTGKPPFLFDDPIAIIHSHLAETPASVHELNPATPEIIGKIVAVLLEKAPEKRYQTAAGLIVDLKYCLRGIQQNRNINSFILKQKDYSNRITIPSLMVGRERQKKQLLDEYSKVCAGVFRASLISGLSGIGKTRLIQELQLPIVAHAGYFTSGKFDQFKKHIPYSTLIQAFSHLIKTFLTEDRERIAYWRQRISEQLGDNGRLITDLVPELHLIIGPQPEVPDLPPIEARNRFNDTAEKFLASLISKEHPLTLFIDDLQWCDGATFDLLERIFDNATDYPYLFWIGAYRHNEVDSSHRLMRLIHRVKQARRPLQEIRLDALGLNEVNQMTAYILNTYPSRTEDLSKIIYQTSAGNPLFVNESLRWLHTYKHLHLTDNGSWTWDDEQLRHTAIPESALDLFKDKIAKLPERVRELLSIGASLGARFDASDLALTTATTLPVLYHALTPAFNSNILLREKDQLLFFHDQVQAAAASFLDADKKQLVHRQIAKALISAIPENADLETLPNLFAIVEHLANGREPDQSIESRIEEAKFNYFAGIAAMKALAMDNANYFFHQSKSLYPKDSWDTDYACLFSLHKYLARTEMALGNQPESEQILNTLISRAKSDIDRIDCLYEQTTGLSSMGKFEQAIALGNRGLAYFNRAIPDNDDLALERAAAIMEQIHQGDTDIWQKILDIEPSSDRATQIETGIYSELIPDYYLAGMVPQLYLSAIQSTQNCLAGGVDESVIYGFSMVGLYLQRQSQYELSFRYEDLGLALAHRYPDTFGATKGINGILWTNMHNRSDSAYIIEQCQKNIHRGKNCGDLYNAGLSYGPYIWHLIHQGAHLRQVIDVAEECIHFSNKFNLSLSLGLAESALAGWADMMNTGRTPYNDQDIAVKLKKWEADKHVVSIGGYYSLKGISSHYLGNYAQAADYLHQAEPYLRGLSDNILNRLWYVFRYVNGLRLHKTIPAEEQEMLDLCLEQVQTWASLGPILKPYLTFMLMEQANHAGNFSETRRHCLDAIDLCKPQHFILLEGFLNERLGQILIETQHSYATYYLNRAVGHYHDCGAEAKVRQVTENYAITFQPDEGLSADTSLAQMLDVNYLLLATRTITQQQDLNGLLSAILQSIMERLGAKTGYLLIAEPQDLEVLAKGIKHGFVDVQLRGDPNLSTDTLSMAIVNYVFRTTEMLVIDNAASEGDFIADNTVQHQHLKSILCAPLLKQQHVLGVLYLENNLITSAFTPEQIELTRLLTAQAAIALENTLLIEEMKRSQAQIQSLNADLEQRVEERTASLNSANEELKHFAYVVSHDLKAPLRAINQLSGWICEDYADAFDEDGREQMALLRDRARRMHEMIDGILQYSRVGRIAEPEERIDCSQLLAEVISLIAPPEHIEVHIQADLPVIISERLRLFQVFQNLLDNAIKYNDKDKGIISVTCMEQDHYWQFAVTDNGPGIDKKYQEKIFQLFQTLKPKDQSESTGIGLSLIEKIVTTWGGKIWLESEVGKGSSFIFTIPKRKKYE